MNIPALGGRTAFTARVGSFVITTNLILVALATGAGPATAEEPAPVSAQVATVSTDRPSFSAASTTVPALRLQLETGFDALSAGDGAAYSIPTKIRFGLIDRFELHLESATLVHIQASGSGTTAFADVDLGMKWNFVSNAGARPSIGLMLALSIPTHTAASFKAFVLTPTLLFDWSLGDVVSLGVNIGINSPLENRSTLPDVLRLSLVAGFAIPPVDGLGLFAEVYGLQGLSEGSKGLAVAQFGVIYRLTARFQLDASVRKSIAAPASTFGGGAGIGVLF